MAQVDANGIVINIIVAGDDWNVEGFVEYTDTNPAYIGGTYSNGQFIGPNIDKNAMPNEYLTIETIFADSIAADSIGGDSLGA